MFVSLGFAVVVCFAIAFIVAAMGRADDTIAHVLYEAEHPEKRR